jgi:hypothetical protein
LAVAALAWLAEYTTELLNVLNVLGRLTPACIFSNADGRALVADYGPPPVATAVRETLGDDVLAGDFIVPDIWLRTFGERFVSPSEGRPAGAPRLPEWLRPQIPASGSIPSSAEAMPNSISYDPARQRLQIGSGFIDNIPSEVGMPLKAPPTLNGRGRRSEIIRWDGKRCADG